jgi:hypothetical protein
LKSCALGNSVEVASIIQECADVNCHDANKYHFFVYKKVYASPYTAGSVAFYLSIYLYLYICIYIMYVYVYARAHTHTMKKNESRFTPLHYAAGSAASGQLDTIRVLMRMGANPRLLDSYGRSAADYARVLRRDDAHTLLLEMCSPC